MIEIDQKKFITALNEVAALDSGKVVIAALKDACRWDATFVSTDAPQATHFYAAQRGVYGAIRQHIKPEHLKDIEFNYKRIETNDRREPTKRDTKPSDRRKSTDTRKSK